ncbi:MAG: hypothetical protein WAT19_05060 [Ferruginibacter sp.]
MLFRSITLLAFCFLMMVNINAQTKKIAWKSHSGNADLFAAALEENLFDMDGSNFGVAPQREIISAQLDSLICVSDSLAIMVTSEYCNTPLRVKNKNENSKWKAGRDTVFYHPLFSKKHSLDSIKAVLANQYYFRNQVQKTVFIGYDNKRPDSINHAIPYSAAPINRNKPAHKRKFFVLLAAVLLGSAVAISFSHAGANKLD